MSPLRAQVAELRARADDRVDALTIDRAIAEFQRGHPGYVRIDNKAPGGFEAKLTRAEIAAKAR